uniref:RNA polymerase sigma factor RpoD/SigA n=1 Tax=candidate division WOR-3 bacterium TaxID=2052148 RepID=A0A7C4XLX6_UNCW3
MIKLLGERGLKQYFEEVNKYPLLDKEEEYKLAKRVREKNDQDAKEKLILSNLRIVISICSKFHNCGLSLSELINAGNQGLLHAVEKYDERKGYRFCTYSVWWIKRAIYEAINAEFGIVAKSRLAKRIQAFIPRFVQNKGREPTIQELAEGLKTDPSRISRALTELIPSLSLDTTFEQDDSDTPYIEKLRIDEAMGKYTGLDGFIAPAPEDVLKKKMQKENLAQAISTLLPREQEIIKRFFGLDDFEPQSLEEISRVLNITKERVRQIRDNALKKLKIFFSTKPHKRL